ncbi:MAG: transcription-repair coupling factor [Eubacteriales bacterium]|jgi:transcription-repair coupling factor (superfamily II helicase)|nr:transcription-repair coupling factor [Clostridiales bacterium]
MVQAEFTGVPGIIVGALEAEREYAGIIAAIEKQNRSNDPCPLRIAGMSEGVRGAFTALLAHRVATGHGKPLLCIVPDEKEAQKCFNLLFACGLKPIVYPFRDFIFHNITASHESEHERLSVLYKVLDGSCDVVIATPDAALQYTMPREVAMRSILRFGLDEPVDPERLKSFLVGAGYVRVELVDGAGQYAVRGDIIDIFPPKAENPVRVEFFGDDIDRISTFDMMTQRRMENVEFVEIPPAREILIGPKERNELVRVISAQRKRCEDERTRELLDAELDAAESGREINSIDKYITLIYPQRECLLDYFSDAETALVFEWQASSERVKAYEWHAKQTITDLLEHGAILSRYADYGKYHAEFEMFFGSRAAVFADTFLGSYGDMRLGGMFNIASRQTVSYADSYELLREDLRGYLASGYTVVIICENQLSAQNLHGLLDGDGIPAVLYTGSGTPHPGIALIVHGFDFPGFELPVTKFAALSLYPSQSSYSRVRTARRAAKAAKRSRQERILSYADLEPGDYVVHVNHGIGQYIGMESVTVDGFTRDYLKIKYAGTDMLYIPCNQLESISKYIGSRAEDGTIKLSKMGGAEWTRTKSRVKAAVKEMARELIKLYAERQHKPGFAFLPDDEMQHQFEAEFEYEETEGQLEAIEEIKRDMEKPQPMDRLLCGDVGFGKTEVALRAAFKAVASQKQVAILVPTTILALQHYQTLLSRMRGFPVKVDMLSRFRTPKQQAEALRGLKRGEVDIIVGTHRLLSKDVEFRDLGLVIVDEEQRFGVAHKEKLKQICTNVDVLTLSATPIPRTLNMALSGIRDMSILEEAPGDRMPVQTYVLEYDEIIIGEAIRRELRRGGQVFYLHNRVESINSVANKISQLVSEARIAVGHGQMDKEQLSDIWRAMISGEIDILVCTTIIESGVDIPNANTLIIEDADKLGLAQLHQLRGRVGRSSRRAYAYFTYRRGSVLSEIATKRLSAIRDYTEFGSGFRIALRDLEIRGAGNMLGPEQHGHIESVGYDLYMRLLSEAIQEEKGEKPETRPEHTFEIRLDAYIPESYIRSSTQRIEAYKKISLILSEEDAMDVIDELCDRYGDPPEPVVNLINVALVRALGSECGVSKTEQSGGSVIIYPAELDAAIWARLAGEYRGRILLSLGTRPYITVKMKRDENILIFLRDLFKKYMQIHTSNLEQL